MFVQDTIKKVSSESRNEFSKSIINKVAEQLEVCGIKDYITKFAANLDVTGSMPSGIDTTFSYVHKFRACSFGSYGNRFAQDDARYYYMDNILAWKVDGVAYMLATREGSSSYPALYLFSNIIDLAKNDYYNSTGTGKESNYLGYCAGGYTNTRNGVDDMYRDGIQLQIKMVRDVDNKVFSIQISPVDKDNCVTGAHTGMTNYAADSNNNVITLLPLPVLTSKKDYETREENFLHVNPVGFYGNSFDTANNVDLVNNKAYIQKGLIAMNRFGIVGELKKIYWATINRPKQADLVSLGGQTYIYLGGGLYYRHEG